MMALPRRRRLDRRRLRIDVPLRSESACESRRPTVARSLHPGGRERRVNKTSAAKDGLQARRSYCRTGRKEVSLKVWVSKPRNSWRNSKPCPLMTSRNSRWRSCGGLANCPWTPAPSPMRRSAKRVKRSSRSSTGKTTTPRRGEVWLFDLGMAAKTRPVLVVSVPYGDTDRAIVTVVPHTTELRGSPYEIAVSAPYLQPGTSWFRASRHTRKLGQSENSAHSSPIRWRLSSQASRIGWALRSINGWARDHPGFGFGPSARPLVIPSREAPGGRSRNVLNSNESIPCRSVGIGRRTGLKIRRTSLGVWVQVPPPAPPPPATFTSPLNA